MKTNIPTISFASFLLQCILIVAFGVCLYLFVSAMTARSNYNTVIAELNQKKQTLDEAKAKLDSYSKFVDANPFFQRSRASLQWEKNDEVWINLSYEELLARLTDLYRYDRPFVLDFFSASVTASDAVKTGQTENSVGKGQGDHEKELVFHLQGYFLCPCK